MSSPERWFAHKNSGKRVWKGRVWHKSRFGKTWEIFQESHSICAAVVSFSMEYQKANPNLMKDEGFISWTAKKVLIYRKHESWNV